MSKKYEREIDLRLYGDLVEAQKYILRAREVLGDVVNRDLELGGLDQAWRSVILDDRAHVTVFASTFMNPIVTIAVPGGEEVPEKTQYLLRLAWKPEGIVLSPRTAATELGWGLPSRREDNGEKLNIELGEDGEPINEIGLTESGSLPQAILNRYVNNKYLDLAEHVDNIPEGVADNSTEGGYPNPQLSDSVTTVVGNDTFLYQTTAVIGQPWSYAAPDDEGEYVDGYYVGETYWGENGPDSELEPGVYRVEFIGNEIRTTLLGYQFDEKFNELITEYKAADVYNETTDEFEEQWYCHRPEEKLYVDGVSEAIFQYSNEARVSAGEDVVYRMIRGDANSARMAGYILTASEGHFFHSHPDFLPGFRTTGGRVMNSTGQEPFSAYGDNFRENLAALPAGSIPDELETTDEIGQFITQLWIDSPPHYANMVDSMWTDFPLPFNTWAGQVSDDKYPDGTKWASHHIGSYGVSDYVDRSNLRDSSETIPIVPPAEDATIWAQIFCARESWVPIYDLLHEGEYGTTGTFNGWNPYSHGNFVSASRRLGWNKYVYQLPAGLVPPAVDPDQNNDEYNAFLACVGSAMIEIDGEKWIRAVYWESDTVIETVEDSGFSSYPQEGDWVRMKVVRFPVRIMETSVMPWRDQIPAVYEVEYEYQWEATDGWFTNPPGKVVFNSTGDKFTFSMHKEGTDQYTHALDYKAQHWTDDRSALPLTRVDIQTHHYEWDETILSTLAEMTVYEPTPLVATVECWTDDANNPNPEGPYTNDDKTTFYKRVLTGQIDVFPHYDAEDVLTYLKLDVNEMTYCKGNRDVNTTAPGEDSYCYRVRKLIFPSTKEIIYMQQYMQDRWTDTFATDINDPGYKPWPGTGDENYFCVIHYLDELQEDVVYSKIETRKIEVTYSGFPNNWYRTDGATQYIADLGPKPSPFDVDAPEQIVEVMGTIAYDVDRYALNVYDQDGDSWAMNDGLPDSMWIYETEFSPCTAMVIDPTRGGPGQEGANTTGFTLPDNVAVTTMTVNPGPTGPPYDPEDGAYKRPAYRTYPEQIIDYPRGRPPFADYTVSNNTGYTYYGDSNCWYFGSGKTGKSYMRCNIAPLFGKPGETRCKVIRYDGRIVAYVGIDHTHKFGLNAPEYFKPAGSSWAWSEWTENPPPEGQEQFIWTNFDLDEAVGIEDINDIWPMGKIV